MLLLEGYLQKFKALYKEWPFFSQSRAGGEKTKKVA